MQRLGYQQMRVALPSVHLRPRHTRGESAGEESGALGGEMREKNRWIKRKRKRRRGGREKYSDTEKEKEERQRGYTSFTQHSGVPPEMKRKKEERERA